MFNLIEYISLILENQVVNFGSANSDYGNCIILAGGPGSGKGYIKDNKILANFKSVDVDELKKQYIKLQKKGKIDDEYEYNLLNPDDTSLLHYKVKEKGWKKKQRKNFWNQRNADPSLLPNVLWDMVSGEPEDIEEIIKYAKPVGYKITIVWVLCNIETAKIGNLSRDRRVSDKVLIGGHTDAYNCLTSVFKNKYPEITENIDAAWIVFTPGYKRKLIGEYEKSPCLKVKKDKEGKFIFNKQLVDDFLKEQMPLDPNWDKNQEAEKRRKEILRKTLTTQIYTKRGT